MRLFAPGVGDPACFHRLEPGFVRFARVRALLHFDYLTFFKHCQPVPSVGEQDNVPRAQDVAFKVLPGLWSVQIKTDRAPFNKKHFLRPLYGALHRIMIVRCNGVPFRPFHVPELLRKRVRREEVDAVLGEGGENDDS